MIKDKKGQGISMTYIVIAALALIVLIVIVLFFTGGMETMFERVVGTTEEGGDQEAVWIAQCKAYAAAKQVEVCENAEFGSNKMTCSDLWVECSGGIETGTVVTRTNDEDAAKLAAGTDDGPTGIKGDAKTAESSKDEGKVDFNIIKEYIE